MSSIKLKHSSGNGVSIAAPESNPASDRTLYVPSNANGTILTNTTPGCILQVKLVALGSDLGGSPTSWSDVGISGTITLASTSNKLLISSSMSPYLDGGGEQRFGMRILVTPSGGSSATAIQDDYFCYRTSDDWKATADHHQALHSPSSTAVLTVKAEYIRYGDNSQNLQMFASATSTNTLLLQEVAA